MKRLLCVLLCLILPLGCACAEGLSGLKDDGLSGLIGSVGATALPLPDPAEAMGVSGSLIRENYQYSADFLCNAYFYPGVDGEDFSSNYTALARESGFNVTDEIADGQDAYRLTQGQTGLYALLVPDFQGGVLLLVQVGLSLGSDRAEEESTQESAQVFAVPIGEFMTFRYNGREYDLGTSNVVNHEVDDESIQIKFFSDNGIIDYMSVYFPKDVQPGDDFITTEYTGTQGLKFYVSGETPFNEAQNDTSSFYVWNSNNDDGSLVASQGDYFHLHIYSVQQRRNKLEIYGGFDGQFYRAKEFFEDGEFFAIVPLS